MNPLFIVVYLFWLITEILLNRLLRSKNSDKQHADKGSLPLIWIVIIATVTAANYISFRFYLPISVHPAFAYAGLAVIIAGVIVRLIAVVSLGRFFTVDVTIRQDHRLKKDGMYKYIRHPSYCASLLSFVGMGMALNNWAALLLIMAAITTVFIIRINIEEKVLAEQFGPEYVTYKKATWRLVPFVY